MTSIPGREHGTHRDGISVCWAGVTKHHGLGVFKNRHLFLQSSGGLKSKVKVLVVLVFPGAPFLASAWPLSLCPQTAFSLYEGTPDVSTSFYKDTSPVGLGFTLAAPL